MSDSDGPRSARQKQRFPANVRSDLEKPVQFTNNSVNEKGARICSVSPSVSAFSWLSYPPFH
jgi:hypothetical protein